MGTSVSARSACKSFFSDLGKPLPHLRACLLRQCGTLHFITKPVRLVIQGSSHKILSNPHTPLPPSQSAITSKCQLHIVSPLPLAVYPRLSQSERANSPLTQTRQSGLDGQESSLASLIYPPVFIRIHTHTHTYYIHRKLGPSRPLIGFINGDCVIEYYPAPGKLFSQSAQSLHEPHTSGFGTAGSPGK